MGDYPVVVEAFVNGEGRVYDYTIVSGNADLKTRGQVEDMLLYSVFAPAQVLGQPVVGRCHASFLPLQKFRYTAKTAALGMYAMGRESNATGAKARRLLRHLRHG